MIAAELSVVGGKHTGQVIPLNRRKFLIGREQDCQLRPNSEMVSRHHCVFSLDEFSVRLRDLGSTNGTFVNGTRIQKETVLATGDHVVIGNLEFRFGILAGKSVDSGSNADVNLRSKPEDTQVSSQTVLEMPVSPTAEQKPVEASADTVVSQPAMAKTSDTGAFAIPQGFAPQQPQPPQQYSGETTVMAAPQMMQPQFGYPQQMMQPMGFPGGMYGGYPYQHMMPGYGQMYPQMMAPQQMGGYQMPPQQQQAPAPAAPSGTLAEGDVQLPDPAATGAKSDPPKGSTGSNVKDTEKPTGAAAAILNQLNGRRPGV